MCSRRLLLVEHHIHGRDIGPDWDKWWNRVTLCASCHDDVHADTSNRKIILGWRATTKGKELIWYRKGEPNPCPEMPDSKPNLYTGPQDE